MFGKTAYRILNISRPRFWMYVLGSYLIGIGATSSLSEAVLFNPNIIWWLVFFTLPANLFVYGINDLADNDTDEFNPKKGTYEEKVDSKDKRLVIISILALNLPFLFLLKSSSQTEIILFSIFVLFNIFYSLPPIRFKAIPFLDSISNGIICAAVGMMGYASAGGNNFLVSGILAGALWSIAMHAYSAIPDIESDKKAGIKTIATVLGDKNTIWLCVLIYTSIIILFTTNSLSIFTILVFPYLILMCLSFKNLRSNNIFNVYKAFPFVTYIVGYLVYLFSTLI